MRKLNLFLTLVALSLATTSLWAKPAVADGNGKLPCQFSVSAVQKVQFSQGNLQYIGSAETPYWKFADEQYEYFGTAQNGSSQTNDRDLFGWGTKDNPWNTSQYSSNYPWQGDWGENVISNGGNAGKTTMWRTLTSTEWGWIFNSRQTGIRFPGVQHARFTKATILTDGSGTSGLTYNICGVILFPDNYAGPTSDTGDITWGNINSGGSGNYWGTRCTTEGWAVLEAAGCVFLPAAGLRNGTGLIASGSSVQYWSSTPNGTNSSYQVYYSSGNNTPEYSQSRCFGLSVRLVQDASGEPTASVTSAPTEVSNLTYINNETPQALVNAGSANGGTMMYKLSTEANYSAYIPTATNAGNYTVQYMVEGSGCFNDFTPNPNTVNVTIAQADYTPSGSYSVTGNNLSYTGSAQALATLTGSVTDGTIYYKLGDGDWSTSIPTAIDIGDYHVWYKIVPTDAVNYKSTEPVEVLASITIPTVTDHSDAATINAVLDLNPTGLKVERTIYADDEYNTICLPFALDASALAASPLAGFNRLKTFKGAQVTGTAPDLYIDIFVEDATEIQAGVPYLITYPSAHADIVNPVFNGITVTTTEPSAVSVDGITFQGMFAQVHIDPYTSSARDEDYLFLGANSQLYWPSSDQTSSSIKMRGFRAYFIIDRNSISPALAPKGTRARIMDAPKITTAIDNTSAKFGGSEKIIENGILYIIRNGVKYNAQGQIVK